MTFFDQASAIDTALIIFGVFFIIRFFIFSLIEKKFYSSEFDQKSVFFTDLGSSFFYMLIIFPVAMYLSNKIISSPFSFPEIDALPLFVRIFLYFFVADFLHYFIHRLMHTSVFWPIHMWHHSPTHMSWLAGFRATLQDATLVNTAFIIAWPLLGTVSDSTRLLLFFIGMLVNDWMHLNVRFHLSILEKLLITPRYHHIHHSVDPKHYMKNFAAIFPVWDKIFKTYFDPEQVKEELTFGLGEKKSRLRLVSGT